MFSNFTQAFRLDLFYAIKHITLVLIFCFKGLTSGSYRINNLLKMSSRVYKIFLNNLAIQEKNNSMMVVRCKVPHQEFARFLSPV